MKRSEEAEIQLSEFIKQMEEKYFSSGATSVPKDAFIEELSSLYQAYTGEVYEKTREAAYLVAAGLLDGYTDFCIENTEKPYGYFRAFLIESAKVDEEEHRRAALENKTLS